MSRDPVPRPTMPRRDFLAGCARAAAFLPLIASRSSVLGAESSKSALSAAQEQFLEELQRRIFDFFWEQADPATGLVKDRAFAGGSDTRIVGSTAATGFGLTALCIAHHRGYGARADIEQRVLATLRFLWDKLPNVHGWFYHFLDIRTGERHFNSELSSIDTALLLCGVITAGEYFHDREIRRLSRQVYERIDFAWMLNGGPTISHGWKPESGFLKARWDHYSEHMMLDLLAIGSPAHPVPEGVWDAWQRPEFDYYGYRFIGSTAPLFVHQYSQAWFDFRGQRDRYANYYDNSVIATKVHRRFCIDLHDKFPDYGPELWGITSSDSAQGYKAWGGPPERGPIDGTVVPAAAGGSIPFLPEECMAVLQNVRAKFADSAWKRYGLVDAFNPLTGWYDRDVIGIDVGITMLMAENARSEFVWRTFMKNSAARRGMKRAGFKRV